MRRNILAGLVVVLTSAAVYAAGIKARPGVFDPDDTGIVTAAWIAGIGLPDAGKSNHGLLLEKAGATATNAAAGASIEGVEGQPADGVYGFDIEDGTHCGAG